MQLQTEHLNDDARNYFLQQGQSIAKLHEILSAGRSFYRLKKWFSLLAETSLYLLFVMIIALIIIIPSEVSAMMYGSGGFEQHLLDGNSYMKDLVRLIKLIFFVTDLPILAFAISLGRSRKKNNLVHEALIEAENMKKAFNVAIGV